MNEHELNYAVHEQELLALLSIVDAYSAYVSGEEVIARVDHRPLEWLQKQEHLSIRQVRWVQRLQEFNLKLEYLPGKLNNLADFL